MQLKKLSNECFKAENHAIRPRALHESKRLVYVLKSNHILIYHQYIKDST